MKVDKLTATDGFVVVDVPAAATSVGVVRLAPKVLRDGAELLARTMTYAFASFGVAGHAGASGAINAKPEARDDAVAAFVDEVRERAASGALRLAPGVGLAPEDLAPLGWAPHDPVLTAEGALAAARVAGPLDWRTAAVVGSGPVAEAASAALTAAGATLADPRFDAGCDVLFVAGKAGVLDHPTAAAVKANVVVPLTSVPVTARALAVLRRNGAVVVPDFLSTAAPLLAEHDTAGGDPVQRVREHTIELADTGGGMWLAAALKAEEFLATWTDEKPFGRPLA